MFFLSLLPIRPSRRWSCRKAVSCVPRPGSVTHRSDLLTARAPAASGKIPFCHCDIPFISAEHPFPVFCGTVSPLRSYEGSIHLDESVAHFQLARLSSDAMGKVNEQEKLTDPSRNEIKSHAYTDTLLCGYPYRQADRQKRPIRSRIEKIQEGENRGHEDRFSNPAKFYSGRWPMSILVAKRFCGEWTSLQRNYWLAS